MNNIEHSSLASPFDAIRRRRPDGTEYWSARELMPLLGYGEWRKFEGAIERARAAAANSGTDIHVAFVQVSQLVGAANLGDLRRSDYELSRYACYLVAMNGDPRKSAIASAQTYFAVKTHEAETAPRQAMPDLASPAGILAMADLFKRTAQQLVAAEERVAELEPKALVHDTFLVAAKSDRLVRQVAKELGWREGVLRDFLLAEKLIYRRQRLCGDFEYDFYAVHAEHFSSRETTAQHTWGPCNHYTLYVTPRGMDLIRKRIAKRQEEQQAAIAGADRAMAGATDA